MAKLVLFVCLTTVRIFFRRIEVNGLENLPQGPVLVAGNHPNGLLDPVVVRIALKREFGFLAKSTLFENPFGRTAMNAFGALPVYRSRDGNDTSKNDTMFDACRARFAEGRSIVMFPEGTSHSDPMMKPLKTGAARIALSAQAEGTDVQILPVGLFYEAKDTFRSRVSVAVGKPIPMAEYMAEYADAPFEVATEVTHLLAERMGQVVLQADSVELKQTLISVAQWTDAEAKEDIAAAQARAQVLADAYTQLMRQDPEEADALAQKVLQLNRLLRSLGLEQPLDIQRGAPTVMRSLRVMMPLILFAPFAFVGLISGWVPYRMFGPVSRRIAGRNLDLISTIKALMGLVFMPLIYAAEAIAIGYLTHLQYGVLAAIALPLCGLIAIRYGEWLDMRRVAIHARYIKLSRADVAKQIADRRSELSQEIDETLRELEVVH